MTSGLQPQRLGPPMKKLGPLGIAFVVVGCIAGLGLFIVFVRFMASREQEACIAALADAKAAVQTPVDGGDDAVAARAVQSALARCKTNTPEASALSEAIARRAELGKTVRARPAMLAAGYRAAQLDPAAMATACKQRSLYVVEMVATNVATGPHYWDCDPDAVYGTIYLSPSECEARKLTSTTVQDEFGKSVGACKRDSQPEDESAGVMRIKASGSWLSAPTKEKLEKAVALAAAGNRAGYDDYLRRERGIVVVAPRMEVYVVEGSLFGPVKVRGKSTGREMWVLAESLEHP